MSSARRVRARDGRYKALLLAAAALVSSGCGSVRSQSTPAATGTPAAASAARAPSGIVGTAVAPVCEGADMGAQSCSRRPALVTIDVLQMPSQRHAASTRASPTGFFRLVLPAGDYKLKAAGGLFWARPITVHVLPHRFTRFTVRLIPRHPLPVGAPS